MKVHVTKKRQIRYSKNTVYLEIRDFQQYHMTLRQVQETKSCKISIETDTDKLLERSMLLSNMEY